MDKDLVYKIALTQIQGIGPVLAKSLIGYCGGVKEVFSKSKLFLQKTPGVGSLIAENIYRFNDFSRAEQEVAFIEKNDIRTTFFLDKDYPYRLKNIPDCPILLYYRGNVDLSPKRCIAIVGTRRMTDYGSSFVHKLVEELASLNVVVVSGLAYGVDVCAHRTCLKNNVKTYGVVAHGLDKLYPALHTKTAKEMVSSDGAIVTEFLSGTIPDRENFPKRNRIVAGMVDAVVVVESAKKGGSLITAELANQYNRDVFALPGDINKTYSQGCNYLLKNYKANVIENAQDLVKMLNWDVQAEKKPQRQLFIELTEDEQLIMDIICAANEIEVDQLMLKSNLPSSKLAIALLELEMKNCIVNLPGKRYKVL